MNHEYTNHGQIHASEIFSSEPHRLSQEQKNALVDEIIKRAEHNQQKLCTMVTPDLNIIVNV